MQVIAHSPHFSRCSKLPVIILLFGERIPLILVRTKSTSGNVVASILDCVATAIRLVEQEADGYPGITTTTSDWLLFTFESIYCKSNKAIGCICIVGDCK